jgi:hypothetical protein
MGIYSAPVADHLFVPARVRLVQGEEHALAVRGERVPAPMSIRLLIDTGAKRTILTPGIVDHLGAISAAESRLVTAVGTAMTNFFWVCLEFPEAGLISLPEVFIARHLMPAMLSQFHGVLGRDVLQRHESFEYLGRRGYFTLRDSPGWLGWLRRLL